LTDCGRRAGTGDRWLARPRLTGVLEGLTLGTIIRVTIGHPGVLARYVADRRAEGCRLVLTNGCFDVLHVGHVTYLQQARRLGDVLIVGLNSDESVRRLKGSGRPLNVVADRAAVLSALSCVDYVVVFEALTPRDLIVTVRPDVYVKGGDYGTRALPERGLVEKLGGRVQILDHVRDRSTTALITRVRGR
jgi:D-beta-D-heptose 7-phosphate kinase/D-beta-D-heptose 1-phosphate adenosyltransferase